MKRVEPMGHASGVAHPTHSYELRVYYQDTDAGGIVYHANYLAFAERARAEMMRALGAPHAEMIKQFGTMFVVRRINLHYQRPARLDEVIRINSRITAIGGASVTLRQDFWRDSDSLAVLEVGLACINAATGQAARLPAAWSARLKY